jgi:hypothetical protein
VAQSKGDPTVQYYAGQIQKVLNTAMRENAPPEVAATLAQADRQWMAMKTLEDEAEKSPTGSISPTSLMGPVRRSFGGGGPLGMAYNTMPPHLVQLAKLGALIREPQSSGTAERMMVSGSLLNPLNYPSALAGMVGGRMMGSVMRSPSMVNMLVNPAGSSVNPLAVQAGDQLAQQRLRLLQSRQP